MPENAAMKMRGFNQGLYEISSTAKHKVGTKRIAENGDVFRYAQAGASALSAGKMGVAAQIDAAHLDEAGCSATAVGTKVVTLTVTAGTAIAENQLRGGYLTINDAAGEGIDYPIASNTAVSATGTSITLDLEVGIKVALTTSSEFTLVHSPWMGVTESTTEENFPVGVPLVAVTATYFYWAKTRGVKSCLIAGTPAVGSMLTLSSTAGAVTAINATLDIDQPILGIMYGCAGVATEYRPVFLMID